MMNQQASPAGSTNLRHVNTTRSITTISASRMRLPVLVLLITTIVVLHVNIPTKILSLVDELNQSHVHRMLPEKDVNRPTTKIEKNASVEVSTTPPPADDSSLPKVAWLLSYPNSGKTYIRLAIRQLAGVAVGSNYGEMDMALRESGPFRIRNSLPVPERYILVETHCSGFCSNCPYLFQPDWIKFFDSCSLGFATGKEKGKLVNKSVKYDHESVDKMIHLIKDPFENIVDRFRFEHMANSDDKSWTYDKTPQGFANWCKAFDRKGNHLEMKFHQPDLAFLLSKVPCYSMFYQYVLWHNNVSEIFLANGQRISIMSLHFDKIMKGNKKSVNQFLEFLELPESSQVPASYKQMDYSDFYTGRDRIAISSFLKVLATQQTWKELKQYLPPPQMERMFSPLGAALAPVRHGKWPSVAWLLAYPNSGTGYTMTLTQKLSGYVTATNNAREMGSSHEDIPNFAMTEDGPFRYNSRPFPKKFILTKNHCAGHCVSCSPESRIKGFTAFFRGCGNVWKYTDDGRWVQGYYHPHLVQKLVHLIRSPFDTAVANFHYEYKYHKDRNEASFTFSYDRQGFRNWCKKIDGTSTYIQDTFYKGGMKSLARRIPCHTVFYQYINWHNQALSLSEGMGLPHLVIYYEDFHPDVDSNVDKLFNFLELPKLGSKEAFHLHTYHEYFTGPERRDINSFLRLSATPKTYQHLQRYFGATGSINQR